jgi:GTP-binding protein EngB required for normal cell division
VTGSSARGDGHPDLAATIAALDAVADLGPGRVADEHVADAVALRATIDERLALGDGLTVVAVAGGTGVGKSALVNRLVGAPVATEGIRRPTTSWPLAITATALVDPATALVDPATAPVDPTAAPVDPATAPVDPATALLRWLQVDDWVPAPDGFPEGLVLLDLPDHDSVVASHRETAHRLARRVDGLIVVVDPVKYARADLHEGPLAALADHAEVVTVALNRIDELRDDDVRRCVEDLTSHLTVPGRARPTVVATSASTGEGVDALRDQLRQLVAARSAAQRRLIADAVSLGRRIGPELQALPDPTPDRDELHEALMVATDAHRRVGEADLAYRRDARGATRSPLARLARLPIRGVAGVARAFGVGEGTAMPPSVPRPSSARIEAVLADQLRLATVTGAVHAALGDTVGHLAARGAPALADAVGGVGVRPDPRSWWPALAAARGVAEAVALVGFVWLVLLGVADWLQLPEIPTPRITEVVTWPTALLLGGLLLRVVLGILTRVLVARGARHHARRVERDILARLDRVTDEQLLVPFRAELTRHEQLRDAVGRLSPRRR